MKKKILFIFLSLTITGISAGVYLYNKPHKSIINQTPIFVVASNTLVAEFEENEKIANSKYLGKVIEVNGLVSEKTTNKKGIVNISLVGKELSNILCEFDPRHQLNTGRLKEGDQVSIKGICTGILMDVVMVDCVVSEKSKN